MTTSEAALGAVVTSLVAMPEKHRKLVLKVIHRLKEPDADDVCRQIEHALQGKYMPGAVVVRVERWMSPAYDQEGSLMHPELEHVGSTEYDVVNDIEQLNPGKGKMQQTYDEMEQKGLLENCLNLQDALAIKEIGYANFRAVFKTRKLLFFASTRMDNARGRHLIPALYVRNNAIELGWWWADNNFPMSSKILRYKNK